MLYLLAYQLTDLLGPLGNWSYSTLVTASICALLIILYQRNKNNYTYWERKGVKGPTPSPFIGNIWSIFMKHAGKVQVEWTKEYGKVIGIYRGSVPSLVVTDPEVLLQLCVKDFDSMPNHDNSSKFFGKYMTLFIFSAVDEHWKRMRQLLSPTFTSGKIKRMFSLINECANDAVECFKEQLPVEGERQTVVNAKDIFNLYTLDGITRTCYGIKLERAGSADLKTVATRNDFVKKALKIFDINFAKLSLAFCVPRWLLLKINFTMIDTKGHEDLAQKAKTLLANRRQSGKKQDDYLQLLIDAKVDDKLELGEMDQEENHYAGLTTESLLEDQRKLAKENGAATQLTEDEIVANATLLLAVGLETTGALLTHCAYILGFHPEIQEKLYEEVKKISTYKDGSRYVEFDYETLTSCRYLDSVIAETLRLMPPVVNVQRQLKQDYRIEKYNLDLPKDTMILLGIYAVHNDPEYWEEPDRFNPERFMPGNKEKIVPGSYLPFGLGPRHCLGMRFSLTEAKLGLAKIISYFRFQPAPGTTYPPEPKIPFMLSNIKKPLVQLVAR